MESRDGAVPHHGKVLESVELRIPFVEYNVNYADKLKLEILKNPDMSISFHIYQCVQKSVSGKYFEFDITTQFNSLQFDMPDFVVAFFQTNRDNNQEKDSSEFDHCSVKNIYFKNGRNEVFPKETWNLDIKKNFLKM